MARARNIKPGFFRNAELVELPYEYRLLFIGLWTLADREGRLLDRPKQIKMDIFPADPVDVDAGLAELEKAGFIVRYQSGNIRAIQIHNFVKHQNPHCKEQASEIPAQCEHGASTVQAGLIPDSPLLIPDSGFPLPESKGCVAAEPQAGPILDETLPAVADAPAPRGKPGRADAPSTDETALQAACRETWSAYSATYGGRYGTAPVRNQKINAQVKQFVQRIGAEEAPLLAAWFVQHPGGYYVGRMHDFGCLLADAEKLRTEWATGRVMTAGKARQSDRAGTTMAALAEVLAEQGEML